LRLLNNLILHSTTQTDDSHAVPFKIVSIHLTKYINNDFNTIGKIKRGLSN